MSALTKHPFYMKNPNISKDQRIKQLATLRSGLKDVPDKSKVMVAMDQQLDKFTVFSQYELNKYRFYSKKTEDMENMIHILDNQILYMDILENEVMKKIQSHRNVIELAKQKVQRQITNQTKEKRREVYDAYNEAEALVLIDKLPTDIMHHIIYFLRPEIRLCILREKYPRPDIIKRFRGISQPRVNKIHEVVLQKIVKQIGYSPEHYTGGKLVSRVYNAVLDMRDIIAGNGFDNQNKTYHSIIHALECFNVIADYDLKLSTPENKDPSSCYQPHIKQKMEALLKMYHVIIYATKPRLVRANS
jgi:hypothetical protein